MKTNTTYMALADGTTSIPLAGSFVTEPQQVIQSIGYSVELHYTGTTVTGTFTIEASNSYDPSTHTAGNWDTVEGSSQVVSSAGVGFYNAYATPGYKYFRVRFTDSSSSANARTTVVANVKSF